MAARQPEGALKGHVSLVLTPGQAVKLSRALVKAAAEALGVEVRRGRVPQLLPTSDSRERASRVARLAL